MKTFENSWSYSDKLLLEKIYKDINLFSILLYLSSFILSIYLYFYFYYKIVFALSNVCKSENNILNKYLLYE